MVPAESEVVRPVDSAGAGLVNRVGVEDTAGPCDGGEVPVYETEVGFVQSLAGIGADKQPTG